MSYELNEKTVKKLINKPGEVRGVVFITDKEFIKSEDEKAIERIEKKINSFNIDFNYSEFKNMEYYPLGLRAISLLAIAEEFEMNKKGVENLGRFSPRVSFVIKFFMKHLISMKKTFDQASKLWKKHYTVGSLKARDYDSEKGELFLDLVNFKIHPVFCDYLKGYFAQIGEITTNSSTQASQINCVFSDQEGDKCTFKIVWNNSKKGK